MIVQHMLPIILQEKLTLCQAKERGEGRVEGGWYHAPQASFQVYLTFPMSTRSKAEYAASIPQGPAQCVNITII